MKELIYQPHRSLMSLMLDHLNDESVSRMESIDYSICENDNDYHLELVAPGFKKDEFNISIENDYLIIKGERKSTNEEKNKKWLKKSYLSTSFVRRFKIGKGVSYDDIKASYEDGILKLNLPKIKTKENKTIIIT